MNENSQLAISQPNHHAEMASMIDEQITPEGLRSMPRFFRVANLTRSARATHGYAMKATLFHARATLTVGWEVNQPDTRLKPGVLVSPRYTGRARCVDGVLRISRLIVAEIPVRSEDLFMTVPPDWVADRHLLVRASVLWAQLSLPSQELFNNVLWNGDRFRRFCRGPSSITGHHSEWNGNLRHTIETAEAVLAMHPNHPAANPDIALCAALLHDVAKADDYRPAGKGWTMTDHGKLNGHKQTIGDWIAVAEARMKIKLPVEHYMLLRHALGAARSVPFESGYRTPRTPEAKLLSLADQSSGTGDLYRRQGAAIGGWGRAHRHLGGKAPYTLPLQSIV